MVNGPVEIVSFPIEKWWIFPVRKLLVIYQRLYPMKSHSTTIFLWFSYGFPMGFPIFPWFSYGPRPDRGALGIRTFVRSFNEDCEWGEWSDWSHCGCEICGEDQQGTRNGTVKRFSREFLWFP